MIPPGVRGVATPRSFLGEREQDRGNIVKSSWARCLLEGEARLGTCVPRCQSSWSEEVRTTFQDLA